MSKEYPCVYWSGGKCKKFSDDKVTSWCVESPCEYQMPSKADRVRAMSDEELAEWVARVQIGAIKDAMNLLQLPYDEPDGLVEMGKTEALEWLKQPAEVNDYV